MQKLNWPLIILTMVLALAIALVGVWYWHLPTLRAKPASFVNSDQSNRVLVVDMNGNSNSSLAEVFRGEDAILVIHLDSDPAQHINDVVSAGDILLAIFDQNKDGRIDIYDRPIYQHLELKYFDKIKGGTAYYMPIQTAGIRAIFLEPTFYKEAHLAAPKDFIPHRVGTAIMSDGSIRLIRHMFVDEYYLKTQPTP